jgi:hypothetical protein
MAEDTTVEPLTLDRLRVELEALNCEPLGEPLGWRCRQCGGRMTLAPPQDHPEASDAFRELVRDHRLSSLLESAQAHQRSDHGAGR